MQYHAFDDDILISVYDTVTGPSTEFARMGLDAVFTVDPQKLHEPPGSALGQHNVVWFATDGSGIYMAQNNNGPTNQHVGSAKLLGSPYDQFGLSAPSINQSTVETAGFQMFMYFLKAVTYQNDSTGVDAVVGVNPTADGTVTSGSKVVDRAALNNYMRDFMNYMGGRVS